MQQYRWNDATIAIQVQVQVQVRVRAPMQVLAQPLGQVEPKVAVDRYSPSHYRPNRPSRYRPSRCRLNRCRPSRCYPNHRVRTADSSGGG